MKRLAFLLSLLAIGPLGLVACGGGDDDETTAASESETTNDELAADRESWCPVGQYRLRVVEGDISCRATRRVILDLANNRLPGSWSCNGDGTPDVVCRKERGTSSRIVIAAYLAGEGAPVEADPGNNNRLSDEKLITRRGNEWAPLFAQGGYAPSPCRYMGQPACERMDCERVGNWPIKNCTPVSAGFRESFADVTVERVVIDGHHATAKFSNGESVEFDDKDSVWFITEEWVKEIAEGTFQA